MRAARVVIQTLAVIPLLASALYGLAGLRVLPAGFLLAGATYLPPSWLAPIALLIAIGCWGLGAKRTSAAVVAAYAIGVVPYSDFSLWTSRSHSPASSAKLSVMALNVQYYSFGAHNVFQAIKSVDADVALLSENVLDASEAEAAQRELFPRSFRMGKSGETAIASKYPILEFKEVELPTFQASLSGPGRLEDLETKAHRSFTHAVIDVDGLRVDVLSVRLIAGRAPATDPLSQLAWGLYLMRSQNAEVALLKSYLSRIKGPFIFGGDLNAPPSSPVVQSLRELATDAYSATHHVGAPTFRVRAPLIRIDYLFGSRDLVPLRARRVEIEVSDHFPVFAEFQLPRPRAQARKRATGELNAP
jgi:endonuclease/exonuclease/phosphatase (EEP) superfamily protein YafD